MKKFFFVIIAGAFLSMCTIVMAKDYTAHDHTGKLAINGGAERITFVITSDDPVRASKTIALAQQMQENGTKATVLFEESAVKLATVAAQQVPPQFNRLHRQELEAYQQGLSRQQAIEAAAAEHQFTGQGSRLQPRPQLNNDYFRQREALEERITDLISYGGKAMACPRCMEAFGVRRASLQEGVTVAPVTLVSSVHSKQIFRSSASQIPVRQEERFSVRERRIDFVPHRIPAKRKIRPQGFESPPVFRRPASQEVIDQW